MPGLLSEICGWSAIGKQNFHKTTHIGISHDLSDEFVSGIHTEAWIFKLKICTIKTNPHLTKTRFRQFLILNVRTDVGETLTLSMHGSIQGVP